jgi:ATP/maltotriose-dependent transcriptional regulator MalT
LDTLEPIPSTAVLSASEAKERLRDIVEGFFFRRLRTEDGTRIRRLLVKSPPGLGKTTEVIDWASPAANRLSSAGNSAPDRQKS